MNENAKMKKRFLFWVGERERIRELKEAGVAPPWTKDPILATYRFCNVVRNDDRVSRWIQDRVHAGDRLAAFNLFAARWINEPVTLEAIHWPFKQWSPDRTEALLSMMADTRQKIFRAAYIINGAMGDKGEPKYHKVVWHILHAAFPRVNGCVVYDSCMASWENVKALDGMGSFMAGQVVADWHACGIIHGKDAKSWAPLGPGSRRGIAYLYDMEPDKVKQDMALQAFWSASEWIAKDYPKLHARMTLHDVQNCFCEFSKYVRGYGKQKFVSGG